MSYRVDFFSVSNRCDVLLAREPRTCGKRPQVRSSLWPEIAATVPDAPPERGRSVTPPTSPLISSKSLTRDPQRNPFRILMSASNI